MSRKLTLFLVGIAIISLLFVNGCTGGDDAKLDSSAPPPLPEEDGVDDGEQPPALPNEEDDSLPSLPEAGIN